MRLTMRFAFDDESEGRQRSFVLDVDRAYPQVPRVGEAVVPDEHSQLAPRSVTQVTYRPDGSVVLDLDLGVPTDDPAAQVMALQTVGFRELDAIRQL